MVIKRVCVERDVRMDAGNGECKFQVSCEAGSAGHFRVGTESLSVRIGQRVLTEGGQEMWDSVVVSCQEREDGALGIKVMVFHPDWEEGRQIAFVESRPRQTAGEVPILAISAERL